MTEQNKNVEQMNISKASMIGKCDEKCAYSFSYKDSLNCRINGYETYLSLKYDNTAINPVVFNNFNYPVDTVEIYSPSIHKFNNNLTDAEIIINHISSSTGTPLMVCVPISLSGSSGTGSTLLSNIISQLSDNNFKKGNNINLRIPTNNLNSFVPNKPYYYYTTNSNVNVVVFPIDDAVFISQRLLDNLHKMITKTTNIVAGGIDNAIFYNKSGPSSSSTNSEEGIYIDCQPTGNSEETTDVNYNKSTNDLGSFTSSISIETLILFIAPICIILIIILIYKSINYFTTR